MVAINPFTGLELWRTNLPAKIFANPVIDREILYIAGYNGTVYSLDLKNGQLLNQKKFAAHLYVAPSFDDRMLYIALSSGSLIAADKSELNPAWIFEGTGPIADSPLVTDSYVYLTTLAHFFYVLDKKEGRSLQTIRLRGRARSAPYIQANRLYLVYEDKYVASYISEN